MPQADGSDLLVEPDQQRGHSWVAGGFGVVFRVYGADTGGRLAIVEHPIWPRVLVMPHVHEDEDEYSYVLEGAIGARIGDRELEANAGSYVLKPRLIPHTFWNPTDRPARILEMISPAGFERFFEELGALIQTFDEPESAMSGEERAARVNQLAARYRLRYLPEWVPELERKYGLQTQARRVRE